MDQTEGSSRYEEGAKRFDEATGHARYLWLASETAERPSQPNIVATAEQREANQKKYGEAKASFEKSEKLQDELRSLHSSLTNCNAWRRPSRDAEDAKADVLLAKCFNWQLGSATDHPDLTTAEELWLPTKPDDRFEIKRLSLGHIYDNPADLELLVSKLRLAADRCLLLARRSKRATGK
jgi:hypothetical protein